MIVALQRSTTLLLMRPCAICARAGTRPSSAAPLSPRMVSVHTASGATSSTHSRFPTCQSAARAETRLSPIARRATSSAPLLWRPRRSLPRRSRRRRRLLLPSRRPRRRRHAPRQPRPRQSAAAVAAAAATRRPAIAPASARAARPTVHASATQPRQLPDRQPTLPWSHRRRPRQRASSSALPPWGRLRCPPPHPRARLPRPCHS